MRGARHHQLRLAALQQRAKFQKADLLPARAAFRLATMGGAEALRLDAEIGSLVPGKQADLAAFRELAFDVIWAGSTERPLSRALSLLVLGLLAISKPARLLAKSGGGPSARGVGLPGHSAEVLRAANKLTMSGARPAGFILNAAPAEALSGGFVGDFAAGFSPPPPLRALPESAVL